jgi:hypothetical protein
LRAPRQDLPSFPAMKAAAKRWRQHDHRPLRKRPLSAAERGLEFRSCNAYHLIPEYRHFSANLNEYFHGITERIVDHVFGGNRGEALIVRGEPEETRAAIDEHVRDRLSRTGRRNARHSRLRAGRTTEERSDDVGRHVSKWLASSPTLCGNGRVRGWCSRITRDHHLIGGI